MFPPHRAYFTDTIIGSVVQQDEDFHHSTVIRNRRRADVASRPYGLLPSAASLRTTPSAPSNRLPSITGLTRYHSDALTVGVIDTKIKKMKLVSATSDRFDNDASKNERQRQKNRMHQASYKMRQRKLVAGLEDSLKKLKEEIPELESQQRVLSYGQTNATIWSIAAEYFRLFRHGVKHSVVSTTGKESLLTYKTPKSSQFQAQWHFMETAMAHDICNGVVSGIQALMDNLIFLSKCYEEFDLRPLRMDNVSENVLNVTTRCEIDHHYRKHTALWIS